MAWENLAQDLLRALAARIDERAESAHRSGLHNLARSFYSRFPPEDLRGRSAEDLYSCLYGLLRFMHRWQRPAAKVRVFNPDLAIHGWESKYTVVLVLCRDMPFCTASVRGELNRRNLLVHSIASCNLVCTRDAAGELTGVLEPRAEAGEAADVSRESLLFFEIGRQTRPAELDELRRSLEDIMAEVALVVDDFRPMREQLARAREDVRRCECVRPDYRDEAVEFLEWLQHNHMTFLGYEYLQVRYQGSSIEVSTDSSRSLGLLRHRDTRGEKDLRFDLQTMTPDQVRRRQLSFSKSRIRSRVHRLAYPDYVEVKVFNEEGQVTAQHRFIGLFTYTVYNTDPSQIPILRRKVEQVQVMSQLSDEEHEGREMARVLELFPRDELFQSSIRELYQTVSAVNRIQERKQIRVFVRRDPHGKFVNCMVYVPRDRYNTELRETIQQILSEACGAEESEFNTLFTESILVRCYFVLRVDPDNPVEFDVNEIEEQIVQATLAWEDRLRARLCEEFGEEVGEQYMRLLGGGFPAGYRDDFDPRVALLDIRHIRRLMDGEELALSLYRVQEERDNMLRLRLYNRENSLPLSDVLPILENLGLRVVSERPYGIRGSDGVTFWVQEFSLVYSLSHDIRMEEVKDEFEDAFSRIWAGEAESDSFNKLLIGTRLSWRELALLRAYTRYLRQIQFPYSGEYIAETMANHLHITAGIVELFLTRFSPVFDGDEDWRQQREAAVEQRILDSLENVQNLGEDRIIRQFICAIKATLRTNFFQPDAEGGLKPYFSIKLNPAAIPEMPQPVPMFEIFVYSPRVEGVHLRGGKVARGGLRWSDRLEDFRTEVLGLVKAQQVKNAVIVPVGAKGGFVAKQISAGMSREQVYEEGIACYQLFIRGLLDLTDNRTDQGVIRPSHVVAKDGEDPYLVVAADKGTASFSDIANRLSAEYGFWLGDAFASGGSAGYDHKDMGITARGAWVSVQRHFRELGIDVQSTDFTVVGVGDMSGDVFGNGMLLSEHIRLVAAFNHQHIFVDPDPVAATSLAERRRLFALPRSGWDDYNHQLISAGGGVFSRSAKSIAVSPEMARLLDIEEQRLTPNELISYILRAPVDLLWNGGIGTYVKAGSESHTQVGDKSNDAVRVDAGDLRCRVVGEGGNLGMTQLARVEFSLAGGRCNTDFIDNAGGVDCSDHEVNIKILLDAVVARGDLTEKQRNDLLEEMTESVAGLVLSNNFRQAQAISLIEYQAQDRFGEYQRFIRHLVDSGRLKRELEFIPGDDELAERRAQGRALTRPELCVLTSYSKAKLKEELMASDLGVDPKMAGAVLTAFPPRLVQQYREDILGHRLHREIMATQVANDIINRVGLNFILRQSGATGANPADIARAYWISNEVFSVPQLWERIEALDAGVASAVQLDLMLSLVRLIKRGTRWLLRNRRHHLAPSAAIPEFSEGVAQVMKALPELLRGRAQEQFQERYQHYLDSGVEDALAGQVTASLHAYKALGIIHASAQTDAPLLDVATVYFELGDRLELDWFSGLILGSKVDNEWQALARDSFLEDLEWQQRSLAVAALRHRSQQGGLLDCLQSWEEQEAELLSRWNSMLTELHATAAPDFAMFAVANRELLDLAQSSFRD